jgi:hypothetical protein
MSTLRLRFGESETIPTGGKDCHCWYRIPFSVVDSDFIGSPEEDYKASKHTLDVKITPTERAGWNFSEPDLKKVMFEIGRREIMKKASRKELSNREEVSVNRRNHSEALSFIPSRIDKLDGAEFIIEKESRRIGF